MSEASLEFFISLAGKLVQGDNIAHLKQLKADLEALLAEKKVLLAKIAAAQQQMEGVEMGGGGGKAQSLRHTTDQLEASLANVDADMQRILREMEKVRDEEDRRQKEADQAKEALRKFTVAATQVPPRDAFVKTLSPAARDAALAKARRGIDALAGVAHAAGLTAANAASAAAAGANSQRMLVRPPTPTPTPAVKKKSAAGLKY
jgi:seryl-tRNA synthetase